MKRKLYTKSVDYSHHERGRKKMAHYLKSADGGFKQIAGNIAPTRRIRRNRLILVVIASILTIIGIYNALS